MKSLFASTVVSKQFYTSEEKCLKKVLFDWASYPEWNPYIQSIQGSKQPGSSLQVSFHLGAGLKTTLSCVLLAYDEAEASFAWRYKAKVPFVYDAIHSFRLLREGGRLALIQSEDMQGLFAGSTNLAYRYLLERRFRVMHEALAARLSQASNA